MANLCQDPETMTTTLKVIYYTTSKTNHKKRIALRGNLSLSLQTDNSLRGWVFYFHISGDESPVMYYNYYFFL